AARHAVWDGRARLIRLTVKDHGDFWMGTAALRSAQLTLQAVQAAGELHTGLPSGACAPVSAMAAISSSDMAATSTAVRDVPWAINTHNSSSVIVSKGLSQRSRFCRARFSSRLRRSRKFMGFSR